MYAVGIWIFQRFIRIVKENNYYRDIYIYKIKYLIYLRKYFRKKENKVECDTQSNNYRNIKN